MRLCRFTLDDLVLIGFYTDDAVIPLDNAAEAAAHLAGLDVLLSASDDLLDYLPPIGPAFEAAKTLYAWLEQLPSEERAELSIPIENVKLLVPIGRPPKLLLLAGNYPKHVAERGGQIAERAATFPYVFMKPPSTTLTDPGDAIVLPAESPDAIDWECELGVVIGQRGKRIREEDALAYVAGYTVVNDISNRRFRPNPQRTPRPRDDHFDWLHGKWHDSSCPMGPCVRAADGTFDAQTARVRLEVNGIVMQDGNTNQMTFPISALIAFISSFMTLEVGDVIATGTPAGVGAARSSFLRAGDLVAARIDGIGTLTNPVECEDES